MSYFIVDVESDGPIIGFHSIVCFGAVKLTPALDTTFYGQIKPISDNYIHEALAISGFSRKKHLEFGEPSLIMKEFANWVADNSIGNPIFISDNNGYDASWINYYMHVYNGSNPFGYSSRRIGDIYCGMMGDMHAKWKYLRKTSYTHHPVDDAKGNAEALLEMKKMGLKINTI